MASLTPYGTNSQNITTPSFDYSKPGMPSTKVYHGLTVVVDGNIIGRIQTWTPAGKTRTATHKWELSKSTFGRPVDLIPGRSEGYTISMQRVEVWDQEIEIVFGYGSTFSDLMDMTYPFQAQEQWFKGDDLYKVWVYPSCWFTSLQEEGPSADGDGIVMCSAEIMHLPRVRTVGN